MAKPSDLGTLGVVLVVVVVGGGGDHFWNLPMCSFLEVCSKVARFFKPTSQVTFPEVRSKRCVQRGVLKKVCSTHLWKCYFKSD